jgi:hypothetical protein
MTVDNIPLIFDFLKWFYYSKVMIEFFSIQHLNYSEKIFCKSINYFSISNPTIILDNLSILPDDFLLIKKTKKRKMKEDSNEQNDIENDESSNKVRSNFILIKQRVQKTKLPYTSESKKIIEPLELKSGIQRSQ